VLKTPLLEEASQSIGDLKEQHESVESEITPIDPIGE
jgi:hypothetical protein